MVKPTPEGREGQAASESQLAYRREAISYQGEIMRQGIIQFSVYNKTPGAIH